SPAATESCRLAPPAAIAHGSLVDPTSARPSPTSSSGSTTTIAATPGCASNAATLRCRTVRPPRSISCLGIALPVRVPRPPATMMTPTDMSIQLDLRRDDVAHLLRQRAGIGPAQAARLDWRVQVHLDVPGAGHQPSFQHDVSRARDRHRPDRQVRIDCQQEDAALEASDPAVAAARAFREDDERRLVAHHPLHLLQHARAGIVTVDEQVPGTLQVPAEEREAAE